MAHTEIRIAQHASRTLPHIRGLLAAFSDWRREVASRRTIADLTADQLKDIGYPEQPIPTLHVRAGLITNLMSMR